MSNSYTSPSSPQQPVAILGIVIFILIAVVGLFYVKWSPYYGRVFVAEATHSIGTSILGDQSALPGPSWQAALGYAIAYGKSIWEALVLGLLLGSAVQVLLPQRWITRFLGDTHASGVAAGGMLAVPSMMCTCCSAPVVKGLRDSQAGAGSSVAYWLGNTMLNPATLIFMGFVLGWQWVGLRLGLGILMVFGLGWLIRRISQTPEEKAAIRAAGRNPVSDKKAPTDDAPLWRRWLQTLGMMSLRLLPEYLMIVLLLGAARVWLFPALDISVDNTLLWIIGLAIAGTLFVIPTAGEVPIVQTALALGMASGPAAALLLTLPPISLPSLAMVSRSFSPKVLLVLIASVIGFGVLAAGLAIALNF